MSFLPVLLALAQSELVDKVRAFESGIMPSWVAKGAQAKPRSIATAMEDHGIPACSVAVYEGGKVVWAKAYGSITAGASTVFQAGSISKSISALGALRLVQDEKLELDEDVDRKLRGWKLPESTLRDGKKVTLRELLGHTAGLGVHGFRGYRQGEPIPSMPQILEGIAPANSAAISFVGEPGTKWRYSGGGYLVIQKLMEDTANEAFPRLLDRLVLGPCGMGSSGFSQPLPDASLKKAATGHEKWCVPLPGGSNTYPELAPAGLWTTPTDLAKFAIEVQRAYAGQPKAILSQGLAKSMLEPGLGSWGLGVMIDGSGLDKRFSHGGRNIGFDSLLVGYAEKPCGFAIMCNANCDTGFLEEVGDALTVAFGFGPARAKAQEYVPVEKFKLDALAGTYDFEGLGKVVVEAHAFRLYVDSPKLGYVAVTPTSETDFVGGGVKLAFSASEAKISVGLRSWVGHRSPAK